MQINIYLIVFVIFFGLAIASKDSRKSRIGYITICSIVLILVAALRSPEWMTSMYQKDTMNYKMYFEDAYETRWEYIWQEIYLRYYENVGDGDIGFVLLNKIMGLITHDFQIYSLIVDLIFFVPFGLMLYRYSSNIFHLIFAFVFYIALVQTFLLAGARQIFALGFDLMSFLLIADKKRALAIICFLLGVSIHFSSFLFIIPLLMILLDIQPRTLKKSHLLCFLLFPIVLLFPNEIIVFMGNAIGMEKYAEYGESDMQGGAEIFILLIELLSLLCLVGVKKKDLSMDKSLLTLYIMAPLFTIAAPLIRSNGAMIRVSLYFHIFLVLLVPYAIDCLFKRKQERLLSYIAAIGLLSFFTLAGGGMTYYFYWQY